MLRLTALDQYGPLLFHRNGLQPSIPCQSPGGCETNARSAHIVNGWHGRIGDAPLRGMLLGFTRPYPFDPSSEDGDPASVRQLDSRTYFLAGHYHPDSASLTKAYRDRTQYDIWLR